MNVSRLFRWFPFAWGGKNEPTGAEVRKAIAGVVSAPPDQTYAADPKKLRHSRLKAELERKRA